MSGNLQKKKNKYEFAVCGKMSLSSCRWCRRAAVAVNCVLSLCFSAVAVECFRNYGGFCPFAPVLLLLLFLSMLRMSQSSSFRCRSQTVAVLVPSMVSSCGRRCRSCGLAVLFDYFWLWWLQSLSSRAVAIVVDVVLWKILTGPGPDIFLTAGSAYTRSCDYRFAVLTLCRNNYWLLLWILDWSHLVKQLIRNYNKLNG